MPLPAQIGYFEGPKNLWDMEPKHANDPPCVEKPRDEWAAPFFTDWPPLRGMWQAASSAA